MFWSRSLGKWAPGRVVHPLMVSLLVLFATTTIYEPKQLHAQTASGLIIGVVTDPSQGAVPDATITITNMRTGITRQTKTNQAGEYRADQILPSVYSIKAEHAGFEIAEVSGVIVDVARAVTVNLMMKIGAVTQTVDVTATAAQLDTATATLGTTVDNATVTELPLNGRSYTSLVELVPGSVGGSVFFGVAGGSNWNVSGMSYTQNSYLLDGLNSNEEFFKQFGVQPSIDALQEFKVQTNITSAEYGMSAGANISAAIKSGTNQLHGSAFEFLRNNNLDAVNWFTNAETIGSRPVNPAYHQNQYGFSVGGPVYIPKVYNGKDKLFWFFNYEGEKIRAPSMNYAFIPTTAELGGDFTGAPPIYDPATTVQTGTDASGNPIYSRQQFSCNGQLNVICPDRIDKAMLHAAQMFYPASNSNNSWNTNPLKMDTYQINTRADWNISNKMSFYARYTQQTVNQFAPESLPTYSTQNRNLYKNAVASLNYVPSPTTVVNFKLGVNRTFLTQGQTIPAPGGLAFYNNNPMGGFVYSSTAYPLLFNMNASDFTGWSQSTTPLPNTDIVAALSYTKVKGRNTIKAGFNVDNFRGMQAGFGQNQTWFLGIATQDPQNPTNTGYDMASYLLGLPFGALQAVGDLTLYGRWGQYDFFGQDDIRLTRKLTVNLGLRWGDDQLLRDRWNRMSQMDLTTQQWVWTGVNPVTGQGPNIRRTIATPDYHQFAPRIGMAYQLSPKTTVRSGYGIFYSTDTEWDLQGIRGQWPYAVTTQPWNLNLVGCCGNPDVTLDTMFAPNPKPGLPVPTAFSATSDINRGAPYTQQWNLAVQRQLSNDLMLEVDYVGSLGTKLPMWYFPNHAQPGPGPVQPRLRWPQWSPGFADYGIGTSSDYNGLQVRAEKRFGHGLEFLGTYSWGHTLGVGGQWGGDGGPMNVYDFHQDYSNEGIDRRQVLTISYIYRLPFGRGQRLISNPNRVLEQLVGGWEMSGITRYNTGSPMTVTIPGDVANIGTANQRASRVPGVPLYLPTNDKTNSGLNPAAFEMPAPYTWGTLDRNTLWSPGFRNWDIGAFKNFPLHGEKETLQFRSEFFNAFNNVSMGGANTGYCQPLPACNPQFGLTTWTQSTAREIQFGMKLLF